MPVAASRIARVICLYNDYMRINLTRTFYSRVCRFPETRRPSRRSRGASFLRNQSLCGRCPVETKERIVYCTGISLVRSWQLQATSRPHRHRAKVCLSPRQSGSAVCIGHRQDIGLVHARVCLGAQSRGNSIPDD